MPTTLSRLFAFARAEGSDPRENFTTEALAGAIRADPGPMLLALARAGVIDPDTVRSCLPFTQVGVAGAGTIDLVLAIETRVSPCEVWVEVKVDAPESGNQLSNYRRFIDGDAGLRRYLVVLSKDPLASPVEHVPLRWIDLARAARDVASGNPVWRELVAYLEEIDMADQSAFPITLREATSLGDAFGLVKKAIAVSLAVNRHLTEARYPTWLCMSQVGQTGWLTSKMQDQFVRFGRVMVDGKRDHLANILYGFRPRDGEAYAEVWVEADPKRTAERETIRRLARVGLDAAWEQPLDHRWQIVLRAERAILFATEADAVSWFVARFEELRNAGIIDLIPTLGLVPPAEVGLPEDAEP